MGDSARSSLVESAKRFDLRTNQVFSFVWAVLIFIIGLPLLAAVYDLLTSLAADLGASGVTLTMFELLASMIALGGFAALVWGLFWWVKHGGPGFVS